MEGPKGSSATCAFLCAVHATVFMVNFLLSCYKVSVLDAIPTCIMALLSAKQGGGFAFCLMPLHEEAVLRPSPVFPASVTQIRIYFYG